MSESKNHEILKQFITEHQSSCPFCKSKLVDTTRCLNCNEVLKLGIVKHDDWNDPAFNRRWRILFLPWFLLCYMAMTQWAVYISELVLGGASLSDLFGLPGMQLFPVLAFLSGWLEMLSPIICILMWRFRSRVSGLPGWLIWTIFGAAVLIWIQMLHWPLSILLF